MPLDTMHYLLLYQNNSTPAFLESPISSLGQPFTDYGGGIFPFSSISLNGSPYTVFSHMMACTYNGLMPNPMALALTGRDFYADVLVYTPNGNFKPLFNLLGLPPEIPVI